MSLIRTDAKFTAGIVCIPLTKPAKIFFIANNCNEEHNIETVLVGHKIPYRRDVRNGKAYYISLNEVEPSLMKQIRRNFTSLRPKFLSNWRYLLWEIDNQEQANLEIVLGLYQGMQLPVYCHKSMRGYHFISLKPINKIAFQQAVNYLRPTNPEYPPISIRLQANKYVNELAVYKQGFITGNTHTDTINFKKWLEAQNIEKIAQYYYVVNYSLKERIEGD